MENIKSFLHCLLVACLIYLTIQLIALAQDTQQQINKIAPKIETTAQNLSNASQALAKSSASVQKVSEAQANLLTNKKTQESIGALLRSSEDLVKLIDNVNDVARTIKQETMPNTNEAIKAGAKTLQSVDNLAVTADKNLDKLSGIAGKDLDALHQLLTDEKLKQLVSNLTDTSASVKETVIHVEATSEEINKAIPELLAELKKITNNIDDGTGEVATFLQGLNKPQTKKQKLFKYLIQAAIIAAPYTIRR